MPIFRPCASSCPRARRCRPRRTAGSSSASASRCSRASARPSSTTSTCRTGRGAPASEAPDGSCRATRPESSTRRATTSPRERRGSCTCGERARRLLRGRRGAVGADVLGRLGAHRRPVRTRRRRVPVVPGPRRRPAQGGRNLGRPARDRELPARPSSGARMRRRRPRARRANGAAGLCRRCAEVTIFGRSGSSSSSTSAASSPRTRRLATCGSWMRFRRPRTARSTERRSPRANAPHD